MRFDFKFSKIFGFRDFMSNFREMTPQWLRMSVRKNFKVLKYEHIIYPFEASDLKISFFHEIFKFRDNTSKNKFRQIS